MTIVIIIDNHNDDHHHHHHQYHHHHHHCQDDHLVPPLDWKGEGYVCKKHKRDRSDGTRGVELEPAQFFVTSSYIQVSEGYLYVTITALTHLLTRVIAKNDLM